MELLPRTPLINKKESGYALAPARVPPDAAAGSWTREPCDDVDPMPDYENVLTD